MISFTLSIPFQGLTIYSTPLDIFFLSVKVSDVDIMDVPIPPLATNVWKLTSLVITPLYALGRCLKTLVIPVGE